MPRVAFSWFRSAGCSIWASKPFDCRCSTHLLQQPQVGLLNTCSGVAVVVLLSASREAGAVIRVAIISRDEMPEKMALMNCRIHRLHGREEISGSRSINSGK